MTLLQNILTATANCNFHFCIYGALGIMFMLRAVLSRSERPDEVREHFVHGMLYFSLGLLR